MGLFIVFEGVEGSGKSTQSKALKRRLDEAGHLVKWLREPGGTKTGEYVRDWLINGPKITHLTELFLFSAARNSLVETVIKPALESGEIVVCDRYIYSTLAYQGYARGLDMKTIQTVNDIATGGLQPDIVVLLDLPPEKGFERKRGGDPNDRFEQEQQAFHEKVRLGYLDLAKQDPKRWLVVDASMPRKAVSERIWERANHIIDKEKSNDA